MITKIKNFFLQRFVNRFLVYFYYTAKPHKINPIKFLRLKNQEKCKKFIEHITPLNQYLLKLTKKV